MTFHFFQFVQTHRLIPTRLILGAWLLIGFAALAGCATTPRLGGDPGLRVLQASAFPAPLRTDLLRESRPYYVGPFDKLIVDVYGIPELSRREIQVDASGKISFPLAGIVEVAGKTPIEVEELMILRLRQSHVRDPQVTVSLAEMVSQTLTVEGQVAKPGFYPVLGQMSLLRAVALSGSTTEYAKANEVVIFRTVRGERLAALYDLNAIRRGQYSDPEVFANDVIVVGDNKARRLFKDLLQVVPLLTGPLFVALN